jgi:hypothetical protein
MITVVGIFEHRRPAESAAWHLRMLGIEPGNVDLSAPREASRSAPLPRFSCCLVLGVRRQLFLRMDDNYFSGSR